MINIYLSVKQILGTYSRKIYVKIPNKADPSIFEQKLVASLLLLKYMDK